MDDTIVDVQLNNSLLEKKQNYPTISDSPSCSLGVRTISDRGARIYVIGQVVICILLIALVIGVIIWYANGCDA